MRGVAFGSSRDYVRNVDAFLFTRNAIELH
jgi:hypothetical protein